MFGAKSRRIRARRGGRWRAAVRWHGRKLFQDRERLCNGCPLVSQWADEHIIFLCILIHSCTDVRRHFFESLRSANGHVWRERWWIGGCLQGHFCSSGGNFCHRHGGICCHGAAATNGGQYACHYSTHGGGYFGLCSGCGGGCACGVGRGGPVVAQAAAGHAYGVVCRNQCVGHAGWFLGNAGPCTVHNRVAARLFYGGCCTGGGRAGGPGLPWPCRWAGFFRPDHCQCGRGSVCYLRRILFWVAAVLPVYWPYWGCVLPYGAGMGAV